MIRLRDLGANTPTSLPYTEDQIMAMVRKGKQRGHILGVVRSDDHMSQLLTQLESQHEVGGGSGSGGGGDDEPGADEDANGDEEIYDMLYTDLEDDRSSSLALEGRRKE
ncbi:hypothetical protein Tco_1193644 [Tanacetum coccineum]